MLLVLLTEKVNEERVDVRIEFLLLLHVTLLSKVFLEGFHIRFVQSAAIICSYFMTLPLQSQAVGHGYLVAKCKTFLFVFVLFTNIFFT